MTVVSKKLVIGGGYVVAAWGLDCSFLRPRDLLCMVLHQCEKHCTRDSGRLATLAQQNAVAFE